ncbi:MAG: phosphoenolpyruvate--protein phosphotransferase [Xanthomonadales bacterium]|nr:phosphoenolpyruvate--protein phosphotransferase [Xanthomonadales bacterium]ODU93755.1 MAG: phosphoenolpyruvate--protein phosphotransferase [Rhodanobacter sp. SCN 66-43]OJY83281.1 MAG: phosphoenolpyruvate--protein phosphotransferase [Xanthomonadales bacterium 66-474]
MRRAFTGNAAAPGMALGRVRLERPARFSIDNTPLPDEQVEAEIARLERAFAVAREDMADLKRKLHGALAREVGEFIDAHAQLLDDPDLIEGLRAMIRKGHYRAAAALKAQRDRLVAVFDNMDDPYLRSRGEDVDHVIARVQSALARQASSEEKKIATRVGEILVTESVAPGELAHLASHGILAVVAGSGSPYSHSAILARSLHLPMLVNVSGVLEDLRDGDLALVDGVRGEIVVHPAAQDLAQYRNWQRDAMREGQRLAQLAGAETRTRDGRALRLFANAERPEDIERARNLGAAGIGLYRTEFLFLAHDGLPGEDEQFAAYRDAVLGAGGLPVTIRTLDLGADKADAAGLVMDSEPNPALGVRGIRLSLQQIDVFVTQLRAILRAGCYGPVRILVPMITDAAELLEVRRLINECARDLRTAGHEIPDQFELGAMVEVPAAAINVRALLDAADFLAIGSNDLTQYVLAADRNNDQLGQLYRPAHPAVLRVMAWVIGNARRAGKPVCLCGEIAGDPAFAPVLVALGLEDFSMAADRILTQRDALSRCDRKGLRALAPRLLRARDNDEIAALLQSAQASA